MTKVHSLFHSVSSPVLWDMPVLSNMDKVFSLKKPQAVVAGVELMPYQNSL